MAKQGVYMKHTVDFFTHARFQNDQFYPNLSQLFKPLVRPACKEGKPHVDLPIPKDWKFPLLFRWHEQGHIWTSPKKKVGVPYCEQ